MCDLTDLYELADAIRAKHLNSNLVKVDYSQQMFSAMRLLMPCEHHPSIDVVASAFYSSIVFGC